MKWAEKRRMMVAEKRAQVARDKANEQAKREQTLALTTNFSNGSRKPARSAVQIPAYRYRGQDERAPSLNSQAFDTFKHDAPTYTGDAMIGVATMHKSNTIPVFSAEAAVDLARMRR